jgi:mRNA interferase MazF
MNNFSQGDIWYFDPDPVEGNEQGTKVRPGLIISCNSFNRGRSGLLLVVPLTTKCKNIPTHVCIDPPEGGLSQVSYCMCEQVRSVSVTRIKSKIGSVKAKKILTQIRDWISDLTLIE